MQRESTNKPGTVKATAAQDVTRESATVSSKGHANASPTHGAGFSAPPASDWARYIDSRLKQFCTR